MSEQLKGSTFEELYLRQRKKSSMLLLAVIVLAITTVGSLAWGLSRDDGGQNQNVGRGILGGSSGIKNIDVTQFFNNDGSVNTDQVKTFLDRLPSALGNSSFNFLDRFKETINRAAADGDITQAQADALIQVFEAESKANET